MAEETTALARIEKSNRPPNNLATFLEAIKPRLITVLPSHVDAEPLIRAVQTYGAQDNKLLKCTESSLLTSLMLCAQLGLPPNTPQGFSWLIPFWNGRQRCMECKVMFGKNGLAELVRNTGEVLRMNSGVVYAAEVANGCFISTNEPPSIEHRVNVLRSAADYADDKIVAAYAVLETKAGGRVQRILRLDEILKRRDSSQAVRQAKKNGTSTPWDDWFPEMCRKTAIRALCTMAEAPKSTKLARAIAEDIDGPPTVELQRVDMSQADGFRQRAIDASAEPVSLPAPGDDRDEPPHSDKATEQEKNSNQSAKPKAASKDQISRLWKRWCVITQADPKNPEPVDKESYQGFVEARLGEKKAKDSKLWTDEDCKLINKELDKLRGDGEPGEAGDPPPDDQAEPPAEPPAADPPSKTDALSALKNLRKKLDVGWDEVRSIARELGVTAQASSSWTAEQCIAIAARMQPPPEDEDQPEKTEEEPAPDSQEDPADPPSEESADTE